MVNKALRIVLYTIFTISLLFVMPVNIYADSITSSNINGVSVVLDEVTFIENKTWTVSGGTLTLPRNYFNYNAEIQFDKSYLGYVDITISYSYFARNDTGMTNFSGTKVQKVFVNGDKAYLSFGFIANNSTDPLTYSSISYTLNSSDLIEYGLISDIQTIIDILQENQDIITDIYSELQTVVSNTSLANTYLETLSKLRQYHYPIESFVVNYYLFNKNYDIATLFRVNYWDYPVFIINAGGDIYQRYLGIGQEYLYKCILPFNINNNTSLNNYFGVTDGFTLTIYDSKLLNSSPVIREITINIKNTGNEAKDFVLTAKNRLYQFVAIFAISSNDISGRYSTDFALNFGLSNQLLDNLNLIANGTNDSSAASSQSDQANSQLQQDSNTLFSQEDSFKQDMNSAMQNIDTTFTLNNFGSSFMNSAQWVRTQYETLTNNTPFASLITFSLLVGLALIVIGKVYK